MNLNDPNVFVVSEITYPSEAPFHPSVVYAESPFKDIGPSNNVYDGIRILLANAEFDRAHFGTPKWNPLGELIKPGDVVLLKPNFVKHIYSSDIDIEGFITHGSVIRAVLDFVYIALKGKGKIIIGDAPIQSADFNAILRQTHTELIVEYIRAHSLIPIEIMDFRQEVAEYEDTIIKGWQKRTVKHEAVNLGSQSEHFGVGHFNRYRVTHYNPHSMSRHHNDKVNEYLIAKAALEADVVINLPKLKCHRKAGITCALKNQVGINASKDWLPHHSIGSRQSGGDEYLNPSAIKFLLRVLLDRRESATHLLTKRILNRLIYLCRKVNRFNPVRKDHYFEGSWYGNDTLWRTILDLNKVAIYATKEGKISETPQRRLLYFVDAVVIGEGEGPLHPTPAYAGGMVFGRNPLAVDAVCASLIGFDPSKIPVIDHAFHLQSLPVNLFSKEAIVAHFNTGQKLNPFHDGSAMALVHAKPSSGWRSHIEFTTPLETEDQEISEESDY